MSASFEVSSSFKSVGYQVMLQHPAHCAPCLNIISGGWSLALDYKQCLWLQHTADHGSSGRLLSHISFCNLQLQSMNNNWIEDPGDQRAKNDSVDCISLALLTHLRDSIAEAEPLHFFIHCVTIRLEVECWSADICYMISDCITLYISFIMISCLCFCQLIHSGDITQRIDPPGLEVRK